MKKEHDFYKAKRGAAASTTGRTRITIYLDDAIVQEFEKLAERAGTGYQTLVNEALHASMSGSTNLLRSRQRGRRSEKS